jgi:Na+/H+ antiporter NhaD/arsenite permease-like protein
VLSTVLDNIAAAMIGGTILLSRYENDAPFRMLVGIICASNLGGAGSPVGDTTTVMMFVSNDPVVPTAQIFAAFVATIPAMILISLWAVRHDMKPQSAHPDVALLLHRADDAAPDTDAEMGEDDIVYLAVGEEQKRIQWRMVMALLAVPGLIIGNFLDQPGLGLWMGLGLGLLFGWTRISLLEIWKALPGTLFLCVLVATAELLPLEALKPQLEYLGRDTVAILMGLLSAWFDNIPLTAVCLQLKGFDWGLLAYSVGYGGSAMWFGSSAGVALGLLFKDVYNTKKWFSAFFVVTATYLAGAAVYLAVFRGAALLIA